MTVFYDSYVLRNANVENYSLVSQCTIDILVQLLSLKQHEVINIHQKEVGEEASFYFQLIENMALSIFSLLAIYPSPIEAKRLTLSSSAFSLKCLLVLPSSPHNFYEAQKHYLPQPCKSVFCDKVQLWEALLTLLGGRKNSVLLQDSTKSPLDARLSSVNAPVILMLVYILHHFFLTKWNLFNSKLNRKESC